MEKSIGIKFVVTFYEDNKEKMKLELPVDIDIPINEFLENLKGNNSKETAKNEVKQ